MVLDLVISYISNKNKFKNRCYLFWKESLEGEKLKEK